MLVYVIILRGKFEKSPALRLTLRQMTHKTFVVRLLLHNFVVQQKLCYVMYTFMEDNEYVISIFRQF